MSPVVLAKDLFDLTGQTAFITGASSGLGARFAEVLSAHGAKVALAARRVDRIEAAAARLGSRAHALAFDVTKPEMYAQSFGQVEAALGPITLLVNNAGVAGLDDTLQSTPEDWRFVQATNVDAIFNLSRLYASRQIKRASPGNIINISSAAGYVVSETSTAYSVSKAAVVAMTKALAFELAPYNIRVNGIAPGYIYSEMTNDYLASDQGREMVKGIPQRRVGEPSDLDGTLLLLASTKASGFMTGSTVIVDGGIVLK
jgi:3-oxoacyl-[acyl-carrier protein] reductase